MKNFIKILSITTFILSTATVISIFYEGMVLKWFPFVGKLIFLTDISFLITSIAGLFYYKKAGSLFFGHLFSLFVIFVGILVTIIFDRDIPKVLFTLWTFYILYFYGFIVMKKLWNLENQK